ncbi:MAG: VWA domain-containing protein [Acidobacteriota bacterium]|jgi:Ca-activated chloride channel family protein|nr:VWA domain-containing protein [Acidobacteriota bacterium]NLT34244.1 VWA domain-containing protein [Acidobacteriota bacterium]
MLLRFSRVSVLLLLGGLLTASSPSPGDLVPPLEAQTPLPAGISDQTYRISVDLVNVLCSVFDRKTDSFMTNLAREDFALYEDGKSQEITNFARETNLPLTLAMLVDTSESVTPKLKFIQDTATSFFQTVLRDRDRAMLVEFDSSVTLLQDFTNDPNKMARQIRKLQAAGGTALYDAIAMTCDEKLIRETGRKAIIIVSDGEDISSRTDMRQALEMALRAESTIFPISISKGGLFGTGDDTEKGDRILRQLAQETGGKVFFPIQEEDLDEAFRQISLELRSQYNLGYHSTNPLRDGSYRKIEIKVQDNNLKLNYRRGYYAPSN